MAARLAGLALALGWSAVTAQQDYTACSSHGDCPSDSYCDTHSMCYTCDYITAANCDAVQVSGNTNSACCSRPFLQQCPSNPAACASGVDVSAATTATAMERNGCPTTDWEYAADTVHRGMRSCADLRDNGECWSSVEYVVGYTFADVVPTDVAHYCPCCYETDFSVTFYDYGSEPATLRAQTNSASGGDFYNDCYAGNVATLGHVETCFECIEFGTYPAAQIEAICPEYGTNSEVWCEPAAAGEVRPASWFDVDDEDECNAEPCCHWTSGRTGGQCWSSLGNLQCKAENIWDAEDSGATSAASGYCPNDPERTFEESLFVKDLPRVPNRQEPRGWEFFFTCEWFNDQPLWRACLRGLGDGIDTQTHPGSGGEACSEGVLSIYFNSNAGVWVLHSSIEDADSTIGNDAEGVITHQTQPHEQVDGSGTSAPRSCDAPWECAWSQTGPRGQRQSLRVCAVGVTTNCGEDDVVWGTDYELLQGVDECLSLPCGSGGTCTSTEIAEYTCTCDESNGWSGDNCDDENFYTACHSRASASSPDTGTQYCRRFNDDEDLCWAHGVCWYVANPGDGGDECRSAISDRVVYTPWFCECLESVDATRYFGDDPTWLRAWFSDGYCDEIFNTPECMYDDEPNHGDVEVDWNADGSISPDERITGGEDCAGQRSECTDSAPHNLGDTPMNQMLEWCFPGGNSDAADGTIDACGTVTADQCDTPLRLPRYCSEHCARIFLDWYAGCGHDNTHPMYPTWIWDGFAELCEVALAPEAIQCEDDTGARVATVPAWRQCDGFCDCPDFCEDEGVDARAMLPDTTGNLMTCRVAYGPSGLNFEDAMECPSHDEMQAGTESHCTCRNHMQIPVEWRCDGQPDCSLGEDETRCHEVLITILQRDFSLGNTEASSLEPLYAFGENPMFVTPENLACEERFITEVVGVPGQQSGDDWCDFGMDDINTCSSGCARRFIPWAEDCGNVDGILPPAELLKLANYLLCCFMADAEGSEYTCPENGYIGLDGMISPNCQGGESSIHRLGDGICDTEFDCAQFQQDFGDCEIEISVDMPFTITGAVTAQILLSVLTEDVAWMSPDDIEVVNVEQTIVGTIDITDESVNTFIFSSGPATTQLKYGFQLWLGLQNTSGITLNQPCDLTASSDCQTVADLTSSYGRRLQRRASGHGIRVGYTVVAAKDAAAAMFAENNGAADLASAIARAPAIGRSPDVLPNLVGPPGQVSVANPTITTTIVLRMSVTEQEFENARGDDDAATLQEAFERAYIGTAAQGRLQVALEAELAEGVYGGTDIPAWASATITVPSEKSIAFTKDVRRTPTPSDSDTSTLTDEEITATIIIVIIGLVVVCLAACAGGIFFFSRRSSKVIIMDEQGNIISSFETEGDAEDLEGEVLQKMLADHIAKAQLKFKAKQEAEVKAVEMQAEILKEIVVVGDSSEPDPEDELDALISKPVVHTGSAQSEEAEVVALVGASAAPIQEPTDLGSLTAAYKRDLDSVMAKRQASRANATKKLAERRAAAGAKQTKALIDAGVDPTVADEFTAQADATQALHAAEELEAEAQVDAEEVAVLSAKKADFDVAMVNADTDEAKLNLIATYEADQIQTKTALAAKRASQKDALRIKLEEKKAAMLAQQKAKVEEFTPDAAPEIAAVLEEQAAAEEPTEQVSPTPEAVDGSANLADAYKRDIDAVMAKRQASRAAAQQKLAERRAKAAAQQKQELADTGVDVAVVEEIVLERQQIDEEEAAAVLKLEAEADAEESELLAKEKAELAAKSSAANDAEKAALAAQYQEETKRARAGLDAKRSAKREALREKLEMKKAATRQKEKQKLAATAGGQEAVAVLEAQNVSRDAGMKAMLASMKGKRELAAQQAAHEQELAALKATQERERAEQEKKIAEMKQKFEELQKERMEEMEADHDEVARSMVDDISAATEADKAKMEAEKADKKAALQARLEKKKLRAEEQKRRAAEMLKAAEL